MKVGERVKPKAPLVAVGTYLGVCIGVIGLGEQEGKWNGKTRYSEKVRLVFELPGKTIEIDGEEKPRQLSTDFSFTLKKNGKLVQFVSSWMGKTFSDKEFADFELNDLIGVAGMLSVTHSEDGQYANISAVIALPEGVPAPKAKSDYLKFDANEWNDQEFEKLPEYLQEKLKKSTQYKNKHLPEDEVSVAAAAQEAAEDADSGEECPF